MRKKFIRQKYQSQKLLYSLISGINESIIRVETKGASYLTSIENYNIEVRKVILESQNHIIFEAENTIEITAEELQIIAENGDIEISADIIYLLYYSFHEFKQRVFCMITFSRLKNVYYLVSEIKF